MKLLISGISQNFGSETNNVFSGSNLNSSVLKFTNSVSELPVVGLSSPELQKAKAVAIETVVTLFNPHASGSGVIINRRVSGTKIIGTIITNGHVVGLERTTLLGQKIQIKLPNGQTMVGKVKVNGIKYAPFTGEIYTGGIVPSRTLRTSIDIAVVEFTVDKKSAASNFKTAKLGDDAKVGDKILSVGTPENSKTKFLSSGTVLEKTRSLSDGATQVSNALVKNGMSGGGIFNSSGSLVGINEQKNCDCQMRGSNGRVYFWPKGAMSGGVEASTIKAFLNVKGVQFAK